MDVKNLLKEDCMDVYIEPLDAMHRSRSSVCNGGIVLETSARVLAVGVVR